MRQLTIDEFELFLIDIGPDDIPEGAMLAPAATLSDPFYVIWLFDKEAYKDGRRVII